MKNALILVLTFIVAYAHGETDDSVEVRLSDGESILGKLWAPKDTPKCRALVIFVHGTGPNTYLNKRRIGGREFNYFDLFAQQFNERGIALFTYNRRGVGLGDDPPYFDKVDREKYARYLPAQEAADVADMIAQLKKDKRFEKSKIALLGASEGTMIASMVADQELSPVDALFLFGYAHDNLFDIIKWQYAGRASMINLSKYFDKNRDDAIAVEEYESPDSAAIAGRKLLQNRSFGSLDMVKDSLLDYRDFGMMTTGFYNLLLQKIDAGDDEWIWNNYFRITSKWLKAHFQLEPNKSRMLRINIPVYVFHGVNDANVPVEGVYDLRSRFEEAGKTNLHCFIFDDHNHDLNFLDWVFEGKISDGLKAVFDKAGEAAGQDL